ncbi:MAG TPA: hypothetical protein VGU01_14280 [Sphingomicrobium sp.]|nr:hypothetical protein [Sphingomicrobium sp.]
MFLSVFVAAAMAQAAPSTSSEMLGINVPDEFQVGNRQRNDKLEIMELVEPPETVDNWSRMITSLVMFNAAQGGMDKFYSLWRNRMRAACPGITDTLSQGTVDGHPALRGTLSCPKNPQTGKPENLSAFVVQGDANLMMAQVAFRHPVTPSDVALIERIAGSLKVCDQRTLDSCSARKATGFRQSQ